MKIIKTLVMLIFLVGIGLVGLNFAGHYIPKARLLSEQIDSRLPLTQVQPLTQQLLTSAQQLHLPVSQVSQLGSVLGVKTETPDKASIPQKTFEFARYTYCQQVVQDYESRNGKAVLPTASPKP